MVGMDMMDMGRSYDVVSHPVPPGGVSDRPLDCSAYPDLPAADCAYLIDDMWHHFYRADWTYSLATVYFFCAAVGLVGLWRAIAVVATRASCVSSCPRHVPEALLKSDCGQMVAFASAAPNARRRSRLWQPPGPRAALDHADVRQSRRPAGYHALLRSCVVPRVITQRRA
jgi:hypothetical protein